MDSSILVHSITDSIEVNQKELALLLKSISEIEDQIQKKQTYIQWLQMQKEAMSSVKLKGANKEDNLCEDQIIETLKDHEGATGLMAKEIHSYLITKYGVNSPALRSIENAIPHLVQEGKLRQSNAPQQRYRKYLVTSL